MNLVMFVREFRVTVDISKQSVFSKTSSTLEITSLISDLISVANSIVISLTYA